MSPFSQSLELYRRKRQLNQSQLADKLGIASSYISILERGHKPPPSHSLIEKIILALNLDEEEASHFRHAAVISNFALKAPAHASHVEYELLYLLDKRLGQLSPKDIRLLAEIFELNRVRNDQTIGVNDMF